MGFWYVVLLILYRNNLNYEECSRRFEEMLPKIQALQDPWVLGFSYLYIGNAGSDRQQQGIQQKYLLIALEIFQKLGMVYEQGFALVSLGGLAASQMDYARAIEYTQSAHRLLKQTDDTQSIFLILYVLADYHITFGNIELGFQTYQELRHFVEKTGNRRLLGEVMSVESMALARYGNLESALALRKRSLELAVEVSVQNDIAWHTWELGEVYRLMGDVEQARIYYQEALPYFEKLQEFLGLGFYHRGLGDIASLQGDWVEARHQYQAALDVHKNLQPGRSTWGLIFYHARLGSLLVRMEDFNQARQHLKTSLSYAEQRGYPDMKALPLLGIASLLSATGSPAQAIEIAACVASQPTTWNEEKHKAWTILEAARRTLPADEAQRAQEQGAGAGIDALTRQYLESSELDEST
jgi:tetratricopeptide (TPR) repeat protein